jgi:hypothetical protein
MRGFWEAILLDQLCLLDWPLSLSLALLSLAKSALLPPNSSRLHTVYCPISSGTPPQKLTMGAVQIHQTTSVQRYMHLGTEALADCVAALE